MLYVAAVASLAMFGEIHKDKDYPAFERFIRAHRNGLPYKDELETLGRFATFKANLVKIEERNKKGQEKNLTLVDERSATAGMTGIDLKGCYGAKE